jgi:hypothetical protein
LRDSYGLLEKTQPEAITAFHEYVSSRRRRAERVLARLSSERRADYLANIETEEYRLGLFARWIATEGRRFLGRPNGLTEAVHFASRPEPVSATTCPPLLLSE